MLSNQKIAVIGAGKLGETIVRALVRMERVSPGRITASDPREECLKSLAGTGVKTTSDNREAARKADIVIVAVRPQVRRDVFAAIKGVLTRKKLVVSTMASVSVAEMEKLVGKPVPVVRTMPNTPCLVGDGMTAVCAGKHAGAADVERVRKIFGAMGRTIQIEERFMNAVTGLSGSGPAFMLLVLEALSEGGLKVGLPRDIAMELIAQTMLGSARLALETREHPAKLKDGVTTPMGCTIDGLLELEEGGTRVALIKAVVRATERAARLSKEA